MQIRDKMIAVLRPWEDRIKAFRPAWLDKVRTRERLITAVSRTADGIEWINLKIKTDGTESRQHAELPVAITGVTPEEILASFQLPDSLAESLEGDIIVSLRSSELLMRVMEFPTSDHGELAGMVGFQMDKISPYPIDQLAISYEVLGSAGTGSLVLMVAARRSSIDAIGDTFESKGIRIHSIDARVLGWIKLIRDAGHIPDEGCEVFVIDDDIDFTLAITDTGIPVAFRTLHRGSDVESAVGELAYELASMLTSLDAERGINTPTALQYWGFGATSRSMAATIGKQTGLAVTDCELKDLPPLPEGIIRRATQQIGNHIELIPTEWVEHVKRQKLRRHVTIASCTIAVLWLVAMLSFITIYQVRSISLVRIKARANAIAPAAKTALENRQKLKALQVYTDRSSSALECLREVTRMLPSGDIEFSSFKYNKGKSVKLDGAAVSDDIVYDFYETLTASALFSQLTEQKVENKTTKSGKRTVYSVNLVLPSVEATE